METVKQRRDYEDVKDLAQKYSLELLLLFGSRISGEIHQESDYDIAYLSNRRLGLDEEGRLINGLLPLFGEHDERKINLVNIRKASPLLLYAMTSEGQVLFEQTPTTFASLRAYAFKKYIETKPLYEERKRRLQKHFTSHNL